MSRLDRGLELEPARLPGARREVERRFRFLDHHLRPQRDVLAAQRNVCASWIASRRAARLAVEHQRE